MNQADEKLRLLETRLLQLQQDNVIWKCNFRPPPSTICDQSSPRDAEKELSMSCSASISAVVDRTQVEFVDFTLDLRTSNCMSHGFGLSGTGTRQVAMSVSTMSSQPDADVSTDDESATQSPSLLRFSPNRVIMSFSDDEENVIPKQQPELVTPPPIKMARMSESTLANDSQTSQDPFQQTILTQFYNEDDDGLYESIDISADTVCPKQVTVTHEMKPTPPPMEDSFNRLPVQPKTERSSSQSAAADWQRCTRHPVKEPKSHEHYWELDFPDSVGEQQRGDGSCGKERNFPVPRARRKMPLKN